MIVKVWAKYPKLEDILLSFGDRCGQAGMGRRQAGGAEAHFSEGNHHILSSWFIGILDHFRCYLSSWAHWWSEHILKNHCILISLKEHVLLGWRFSDSRCPGRLCRLGKGAHNESMTIRMMQQIFDICGHHDYGRVLNIKLKIWYIAIFGGGWCLWFGQEFFTVWCTTIFTDKQLNDTVVVPRKNANIFFG